jgi:hypothetical protein
MNGNSRNVHNAKFIEFASDSDVSHDAIDNLVVRDLTFYYGIYTPIGPAGR